MASLGALVTLTHAVDSDERFEVFDNTALGPGEEFFFATSASLINDVVRHTCCVWNFWSLADGTSQDAAAVALAKTSIEECKSRCEFFDNCYALVYNGPEVASKSSNRSLGCTQLSVKPLAAGADCQYFHYDANGLYNRASDFQYFLARCVRFTS